jgi:alpha-beta hydrolase superfamily lysophospholipase
MLRPGSLQADLCRVIDDTRQHPSLQGTPLILLGHSMGGLVVARTLAEGLRPVDAAVLSSPALGATRVGFGGGVWGNGGGVAGDVAGARRVLA